MDRFIRSPDLQDAVLPDVPLYASRPPCMFERDNDIIDCIKLSDPPIQRAPDRDPVQRLRDYPIYRPLDNPTVYRPADPPTPQRTP